MQIQIKFDRECRLGVPEVRCTIDEMAPFFEGPCEDLVSAEINVAPGFHELVIGHYNKKHEHHVLDHQGNILIDRHVEISMIAIDGIDFLLDELRRGQFYPAYSEDYVKDCAQQGLILPYSISPNLYLGHNGTWKLAFHTPFIDWIIQQRKQLAIQLDKTIFQSDVELLQQAKQWFHQQPDIRWNI